MLPIFLTEGVAALAKAPLSSKLMFCSVRGFESRRGQKYEKKFLYRLIHIFFLMKYKKGVFTNYVDTFLDLFDPLFLLMH